MDLYIDRKKEAIHNADKSEIDKDKTPSSTLKRVENDSNESLLSNSKMIQDSKSLRSRDF